MRAAALLLIMCAACDDGVCDVPQTPLPTEGALADPLDPIVFPLPAECVVNGLEDLPGRWFIVDPTTYFKFEYPQFEGSCDDGFVRSFASPADHDLSDGRTQHTWSDGTRLFRRTAQRFLREGEEPFDRISASVTCVMPDDTLATAYASFDTDNGVTKRSAIGKRFGRKDVLASGIELVGEIKAFNGGRIVALNLVIEGTHAYIAGIAGFDIVDVSDPTRPVHVSHVDGSYNDIRVLRHGEYVVAYLSPRGGNQTAVINVTDPSAPVLTTNIEEYSHSIFLTTRDTTPVLYLATYTENVPRYDLTDPRFPTRMGHAIVPGEIDGGVHDLFVDGDHIYANNTGAGFVAFDISAGIGTAVELGRTTTAYSHASWIGTAGGRRLALHGDEGMTASSDGGAFLRVLDGDPASSGFMSDIGRYQSRPEVGIHNFELHGDRAYIAYYQDGVRVVDLSNPAEPREVAHYNTWNPETAFGGPFEGAIGIRRVNGLIYIADDQRGLIILREL